MPPRAKSKKAPNADSKASETKSDFAGVPLAPPPKDWDATQPSAAEGSKPLPYKVRAPVQEGGVGPEKGAKAGKRKTTEGLNSAADEEQVRFSVCCTTTTTARDVATPSLTTRSPLANLLLYHSLPPLPSLHPLSCLNLLGYRYPLRHRLHRHPLHLLLLAPVPQLCQATPRGARRREGGGVRS